MLKLGQSLQTALAGHSMQLHTAMHKCPQHVRAFLMDSCITEPLKTPPSTKRHLRSSSHVTTAEICTNDFLNGIGLDPDANSTMSTWPCRAKDCLPLSCKLSMAAGAPARDTWLLIHMPSRFPQRIMRIRFIRMGVPCATALWSASWAGRQYEFHWVSTNVPPYASVK